ncbi:hypothetical protein CRV01_11700 [Arcobacter sp. CECT 8983]|uniref:hypothetical protein n=1 Tax=Arcobacter sp. CECT 8983 TaxID=2044508 RepID=UPI00100C29DA|nr:hypothetical protein [Arcobacter sp. CECT 8983]RXJ89271.1 hypothetical protein CRV01_11700 [Arcobacter sp. CECT 8983]
MKPYSLLFLTLFSTLSFSNDENKKKNEFLSFEIIKKEEKGLRRDFFINEFLKQDSITQDQAYESLKYIDSMNSKLFTNFAIKYKHDETLAVVQCMNMPTKQLIKSYDDCIKVGLNYYEASKLDSLQLNQLINKTSEEYPLFAKNLKVLSSSIPFTKIITLNRDSFYELYFSLPVEFKENYLNYRLPRKTFFRIYEDKVNFEKYLKENITNRTFDIVNDSLLSIDDTDLNANSSFLLGINAFTFKNKDKAIIFFQNALNKTDEENINKILFWLYKTTNNKAYLKDITFNNKIDIYTILANELLEDKIKFVFKQIKNKEFIKITKKLSLQEQALLYSLIKVNSNFDNKFISKEFTIGLLSQNYKLENIEDFYKNGLSLEKSIFLLNKELLEDININPIIKYLTVENKNNHLKLLKKNFKLNEKLDKNLAFEFITDKKLEEFILNYYFYINNNTKKGKKKIKLSSIFENLK